VKGAECVNGRWTKEGSIEHRREARREGCYLRPDAKCVLATNNCGGGGGGGGVSEERLWDGSGSDVDVEKEVIQNGMQTYAYKVLDM